MLTIRGPPRWLTLAWALACEFINVSRLLSPCLGQVLDTYEAIDENNAINAEADDVGNDQKDFEWPVSSI